MIDGREIIEATAVNRAAQFGRRANASGHEEEFAARFALRFLENCPEEATVLELRDAIQEAFPRLMSGGF